MPDSLKAALVPDAQGRTASDTPACTPHTPSRWCLSSAARSNQFQNDKAEQVHSFYLLCSPLNRRTRLARPFAHVNPRMQSQLSGL